MLGKGAKRKLDENDDGLEGKAVAAAGAPGGDGPSKVSYTLQRQTIFNISLMKLYNHRALTEPSLEKRVLINNMLRRIQEELKQEGSLRPMFFSASQPADDALDEGYREAQPAFGGLSPPAQPSLLASTTPLESCLTPASLLEDDASSFCTSSSSAAHLLPHPDGPAKPPTAAVKDSFSSALDEIEELCPTTTSPGAVTPASPLPQPPSALNSKDGGKVCSQKFEGLTAQQESKVAAAAESRLMDSLPSSNLEITTSTGFLTDLALDDILFADIDTSMYDFDPCTSATGTTSKIAPVTADDLLKTLSPYNNQPVTPNQPFKMDLTELDHIMEVLVGS
ncbi:SERTA domain-containing protein 2b [Lepisosteus oculatus]|uniref:SERTA domain containing 2b n=1 Tax=Lepisosteus oculatus TaxID=7918 RepID=W5NLF7_LEPOC|nr:PREDICTED: SERTA domain-containing protein 2 [Lepisosteus oculatus]XP_015218639.1 PREDICTED: SERTA domain-containing protein 2 [Lepisosteus oculatus]XP_015218640.1 PREDICTED: SERTA domain-containing protein 2 [Lepisosteus oculatus]XP_015218641.1 PREDICTED: SERTA domain-containing protein 2 [Lepisosteus oculatus]XP_015218643.1 PREDICTED: SERTA domain-containing protein 2 [Lepisosteus oculatus]XP_015218644.1 PREDICTED: SERTA domain-containing protein 2 [Lepisosteus oculatus]XP_015218645.1 PR